MSKVVRRLSGRERLIIIGMIGIGLILSVGVRGDIRSGNRLHWGTRNCHMTVWYKRRVKTVKILSNREAGASFENCQGRRTLYTRVRSEAGLLETAFKAERIG